MNLSKLPAFLHDSPLQFQKFLYNSVTASSLVADTRSIGAGKLLQKARVDVL